MSMCRSRGVSVGLSRIEMLLEKRERLCNPNARRIVNVTTHSFSFFFVFFLFVLLAFFSATGIDVSAKLEKVEVREREKEKEVLFPSPSLSPTKSLLKAQPKAKSPFVERRCSTFNGIE